MWQWKKIQKMLLDKNSKIMIDTELFKKTYQEIDEKVQKIRLLPMLYTQERDYDGWEYEEYNGKEVINVMSSYWTQGCGEDTSSIEIPLSAINNSIEWFKEKFQKEIEENKRKIEEYRKAEKLKAKEYKATAKSNKEKADMATYRRIKKQLENGK